jgi:hypothetical protein
MTDNRIKEFKYHLETINGYLFDEKVEEITNWISENDITEEEAIQLLEELPEGYFMRQVLDNIVNNDSDIFSKEDE